MEITVEKINGKIGVAVSGGMDSMALLNAYLAINQDLCVINIEHGIRGKSSIDDSNFVRNYCKNNNVECLSFSVDTLNSMANGESVETCARRLRYQIFDKLLFDGTVQKIALAHHADDNVETVLMRIFRGTGINGLIGISDRENYIRPLIKFSKEDVCSYVKTKSIPFVTDETNANVDYTRNYVRNEIIPKIKDRYPSLIESVSRLCSCAQEINSYINSQVAPFVPIDDGCLSNGLFGYPLVIIKYTIMAIIKNLGYPQDFENRHVESVVDLINKPNNTVIDLPFNMQASRFNDDLYIYKNREYTFCEPFSIDSKYTFCDTTYSFQSATFIRPHATINLSRLPSSCHIRTRKDGDVFKKVNGKTKLLSDFLNEKKLPIYQKNRILVLAKDNEIFAVLGIETADSVKVENLQKDKIIHIIKE